MRTYSRSSRLNVLVLTRTQNPTRSTATRWAQGGIIFRGEGDSPELLAEDIYTAGHSFGNLSAIRHLAKHGPQCVEDILINRLGVPFDRTASAVDEFDTTEEAAHSVRRIIHCSDATGASIEQRLIEELQKMPNVRFMTRSVAVELMTLDRHSTKKQHHYAPPTCIGAYVLSRDTGEIAPILDRKSVV